MGPFYFVAFTRHPAREAALFRGALQMRDPGKCLGGSMQIPCLQCTVRTMHCTRDDGFALAFGNSAEATSDLIKDRL